MEALECPGCRERDARILELEAKVRELEGLVRDLMDKVKSLTKPPAPPPSAPQLPKGPAKKATGRKPGGQQGHPPQLKKRLPPERIHEVIPFVPKQCEHCQASLPAEAGPNDPPPTWHQVAELPALAAKITEYQGHFRTCPGCGEVNKCSIPDPIRAQSFGPRLTAVLSYFAGCHGVSKRGIEEITEAVFDVPIALGTVANLEQEMSAALAAAHQEALKAVAAADIKHADETSWKQNGRKRWLWVGATGVLVAFLVTPWRNVQALREMFGEKLIGILLSDRWRVYDAWPLMQRQLCWAHLKRNWEKQAERGGKAKSICEQCLSVQKRVFELWHLFRGGGCTRQQMGDQMVPLVMELLAILQAGSRSRDRTLARFCKRILGLYPALWTFATVEGVDPTNNHAERVQRRAVLWRRRSFGCHSAAGCRFVERILTAVQSLRLQKRPVVEFLHQAIVAHRNGQKCPTLVISG